MSSKKTPQRTMQITVSPDELVRYETAAFEALRGELELPGFRRGHAPDELARQHIAPERIFREAVERAIAEKGSAALDALTEEWVGEPKVEIVKAAPGNPLEFRVTVEVLPEISLEGWRTIRIARREAEVDDEDVVRTLEELRRSRAKYRAVLRPAALGDFVEVDFVTRVDGVAIEGGASKNHPVVLGEGRFLPGFEDAIVGMSVGEEKTVRLSFPHDWARREYAGREGEFTITVRNIQERLLPDIDDAFAQSLGRFANLDDLKRSIREGLLEERREAEKRRIRIEALEKLAERVDAAAIPEALLAQEIDRMKEEFRAPIERHGMPFQEYLSRLGKEEKEFSSDWRDGAIRRVKAALVLRALAREEGTVVAPDEVEERLQEIVRRERLVNDADSPIDLTALRSYTENVLRNEKTMELIEHVVSGNETRNPKP